MKAFIMILSLGILCWGGWFGVASADSLAVPVSSFGAEGRDSTLTIVFGSPVAQMGGGMPPVATAGMTVGAGSVTGNDVPQAPVVVSVASADVVADQPLLALNAPVQPLKLSSEGTGSNTAIPEPSTLLLLGAGVLGLVALAKRTRRNR